MANYIDEKLYSLIGEFERNDFYQIYSHMVKKFRQIPKVTQSSLESYFNRYNYWGSFNISEENFEVFFKKAKIFKENSQDYIWLYENLADYQSKHLLYAILNNFYNFDFNSLKNATENVFLQYFDLNLLPKCKNEIFVDIGAYVGDTVIDFIKSYGQDSYEKIYCYDITDKILDTAKNNLSAYKNIEFRNKAVSNIAGMTAVSENTFSASANKTDSIEQNGIQVESIKLDDDIQDKITLIKMDIEGGEQDAIRGSFRHIREDLPKMFLSVYHNNIDLIEIPKMINNITPQYNFYLRYYGGCVYPTEIVLVCLPKTEEECY